MLSKKRRLDDVQINDEKTTRQALNKIPFKKAHLFKKLKIIELGKA